MICKLKQTSSGSSCTYEVESNGEIIATAVQENNITYTGGIKLFINNELKYQTKYDVNQRINDIGKKYYDKNLIPFKILDINNNECGLACIKEAQTSFFNRYSYTELSLNNEIYYMYCVGMGKEGLKYPIYKGNIQIALMEKENIVINNLDEYVIYMQDDNYLDVALLIALYVDTRFAANRGVYVSSSVHKTYSLTFNKELKSKYNPEYKNMVLNSSNG